VRANFHGDSVMRAAICIRAIPATGCSLRSWSRRSKPGRRRHIASARYRLTRMKPGGNGIALSRHGAGDTAAANQVQIDPPVHHTMRRETRRRLIFLFFYLKIPLQ
jgi:hypothetical protein